ITGGLGGDDELVDRFAGLKSMLFQLFSLRIQLNSIFVPVSLDGFRQPVDSFYGQRELGAAAGVSLEQEVHRSLHFFASHKRLTPKIPSRLCISNSRAQCKLSDPVKKQQTLSSDATAC